MRTDLELPFFFGPEGGLFGMYHAPTGCVRYAALLCPPLGQDLIRCHRLYRQLAQALAEQGVAVLRFDYHGTGDSAGHSADVDWHRCIDDTRLAAAELRARSGVDRLVAFGARLGGSVALSAAPEAGFAEVIAWDPVLDGNDHVQALDAMQAALREDAGRFTTPRNEADVVGQWLGFDIPQTLRRQLASLRIDATEVPALILDSIAGDGAPAYAAADGRAVLPIAPSTPWHDLRRLETAILSRPLVQAVSRHVRELA